MSRRLPALASSVIVASLVFVACATDVDVESQTASVVYGKDDRQDLYQAPPTLAKLANSSVVSLIETANLDLADPANVKLRSDVGTLGSWQGVCFDERFFDQPAAASCSGTLIDDDLVLTAGHCMRNTEECRGYYAVFGYAMKDATTLATIRRDQVFSCRKLVGRAIVERGGGPKGGGQRLDYAIFQLDRPATPRFTPLEVDTTMPVVTGTPLVVVGSGSGLPLKIDSGGVVTAATGELSFTADVDTFAGNSGSGVLVKGRVAGILVRGDEDYLKDPTAGCYRVNALPTNKTSLFEQISYAGRAIGELCSSEGDAWPSGRLCGTKATCGDGKCTGTETDANCAKDCPTHTCGDGVCDLGEEATCTKDCPARMVTMNPPQKWTCPRGFYGTGDGCHCNCGAPDPDCNDWPDYLPARNCGPVDQPFCSSRTAQCISRTEWTCPPRFFEDGVCDCDCGIPDPDCAPNRCDTKEPTCAASPSRGGGPNLAAALVFGLLVAGTALRRRRPS